MPTPTERRINAITKLANRWIDQESHKLVDNYDRECVAEDIRASLSELGRSANWKAAVSRYALMVENADDETDNWAFLQGMVWITHAA